MYRILDLKEPQLVVQANGTINARIPDASKGIGYRSVNLSTNSRVKAREKLSQLVKKYKITGFDADKAPFHGPGDMGLLDMDSGKSFFLQIKHYRDAHPKANGATPASHPKEKVNGESTYMKNKAKAVEDRLAEARDLVQIVAGAMAAAATAMRRLESVLADH